MSVGDSGVAMNHCAPGRAPQTLVAAGAAWRHPCPKRSLTG